MNYTYILECKDGTYYTGWTNNLEKRLKDHMEGKFHSHPYGLFSCFRQESCKRNAGNSIH